MSKRAGGGGNATVTRGLCVGYLHKIIEGIKTYKPEVKASKSDKRLQSYGHSKFCMFSYSFPPAYEQCSRLLGAAQTPTREHFDIPASNNKKNLNTLQNSSTHEPLSTIMPGRDLLMFWSACEEYFTLTLKVYMKKHPLHSRT